MHRAVVYRFRELGPGTRRRAPGGQGPGVRGVAVNSSCHAEPRRSSFRSISHHEIHMPRFEDLRVFQLALDVMVDVYAATRLFPKAELYGLTSQLRRAACSVVSNIAEGQGRLTFGERRQMLSQARGSLFEVEAQVLASVRLHLLEADTANQLQTALRKTAQELAGLITWVRRREAETKRGHTTKPRTPGP